MNSQEFYDGDWPNSLIVNSQWDVGKIGFLSIKNNRIYLD